MLCSILEESIQAGALLRQKNGYFKSAHARAHVYVRARARPGAGAGVARSCIIFVCTVQSAERVAREDSLLEFPVPSSHGSKD